MYRENYNEGELLWCYCNFSASLKLFQTKSILKRATLAPSAGYLTDDNVNEVKSNDQYLSFRNIKDTLDLLTSNSLA